MSTPPRPVTPLGILAAMLEDLDRRLSAGTGAGAGTVPAVDADFGADLHRAWQLAAGLDPYLAGCTTPESPALGALAARTAAHDWAGTSGGRLEQEMLSGHVEGRFLAFLVHITKAVRVLELGLFTGYSALAMAEALPAGGTVVACEADQEVADLAGRWLADSPAGVRVDIRVGPAQTTLDALAETGEPFDLVFIDADKAGYARYLDTILDADLLAAGGVICVDNTLMQGLPWLPGEGTANGAAITAFNRAVVADVRVEQVLVPLRDGLTLIRRV